MAVQAPVVKSRRSPGPVAARPRTAAIRSTAGSEAGHLANQVLAEGRDLLDEASIQLREQVEVQGERLVGGIRRLGEQVQALAEGNPDQAGPFDDYARDLAERINGFAADIELDGVRGLVREVEEVARKRPALFLLGAAAMGVGAGRLLRASTARDDEDVPKALPALRSGVARPGIAGLGGR